LIYRRIFLSVAVIVFTGYAAGPTMGLTIPTRRPEWPPDTKTFARISAKDSGI